MSRTQAALARLVLCAAAWAAGSTLADAVSLHSARDLVGIVLAAAAYLLTQGIGGGGGRRRGEIKYWRGRPVDF